MATQDMQGQEHEMLAETTLRVVAGACEQLMVASSSRIRAVCLCLVFGLLFLPTYYAIVRVLAWPFFSIVSRVVQQVSRLG